MSELRAPLIVVSDLLHEQIAQVSAQNEEQLKAAH